MKKLLFIIPISLLILTLFTNCPTDSSSGPGHTPTHLYYAEQGNRKITKVALDDKTDSQVVVTLPAFYSVYKIVVDGANNMLYFTDTTNDKIYRFSLDNTADIEEFANPAGTPSTSKHLRDGIDIDTVNNQIYWIYRQDGDTDYIQKLNIDKSGSIEDVVTVLDADGDIMGFDVSVSLNKLVFCVDAAANTINVTDLSASSIAQPVSQPILVSDVEIDEKNSKIFYYSGATGITSVNFDGTNQTGITIPGSDPECFAFDSSRNQIYWSENGSSTVYRSDMDPAVKEEIAGSLNIPRGICIY